MGTILNFRHFLEDNGLTAVLLDTINAHLKANGLLVSKGTMVDATIVHAPSSTKNQDKARAPDMQATQKNGQWHFGMKIHIGVDVNSADITELPNLLRKHYEVCSATPATPATDTSAAPAIW